MVIIKHLLCSQNLKCDVTYLILLGFICKAYRLWGLLGFLFNSGSFADIYYFWNKTKNIKKEVYKEEDKISSTRMKLKEKNTRTTTNWVTTSQD